jgi:adenylate cyclase
MNVAAGVVLAGIFAEGDAGLGDFLRGLLGATIVTLTISIWLIAFISDSVATSMRALREGARRIGAGELDATVPVASTDETGELAQSFNEMAAGLRERERIQDLFGRHVGEDVARAALEREIALGGESRQVAVLFTDVIGSTELATRRPPEEVVELLNEFFAIVVEIVDDHGGWVNKFEGDAALAVFGAPVETPDFAGDALAAARELRERLDREVEGLEAAIGVSAGEAVAGNVGEPVNEAARLTELAKDRTERLLASEAAIERAGEDERRRWRLDDSVQLRGRDEETRLAVPTSD